MEILKAQLDALINELPDAITVRERIEDVFSVYPFNAFEYTISTLLGRGVLTLEDYYEIRDDYLDRNMFLSLFEISAPRTFGESWAQTHLKGLVPDLQKPSRKLDTAYSGQYDFFLDSKIRIEVKASRAVDANSTEPLYIKALASDSERPFDMNFQQIKPTCCDVFVWIAVWRDVIRYWVLSSNEVEANRYYSKGQHRGNVGEGQLHVHQDNIREFEGYKVASDGLAEAIRGAYQRQMS